MAKSSSIPTAGIRRREGGSYQGVIRVEGKVVWGCPHHHQNRDTVTHLNTAASPCALIALDYAKGVLPGPTYSNRDKAIQDQRIRLVPSILAAIPNLRSPT